MSRLTQEGMRTDILKKCILAEIGSKLATAKKIKNIQTSHRHYCYLYQIRTNWYVLQLKLVKIWQKMAKSDLIIVPYLLNKTKRGCHQAQLTIDIRPTIYQEMGHLSACISRKSTFLRKKGKNWVFWTISKKLFSIGSYS